MPKDKSSRASASQKSRYHAYKPLSSHGKGHDLTEGDTSEGSAGKKDWEDATCPICMDFPHNAVLLFCTSHDKGCHPYICNTSYRHSNCLDQYQKAHLGIQKTCVSREPVPESSSGQALDARVGRLLNTIDTDSVRTTRRSGRNIATNGIGEATGVQAFNLESVSVDDGECGDEPERSGGSSSFVKGNVKGLLCPLCRGKVKGWKVVNSAREHLNHKARNCAHESCSFTGTYEELRVHARREHPLARPSEIDPVRERDWRRLERRRDLGDVLSTIHSAMPGATVFGDYVIEDDLGDEDDGIDFPGDDGHWWTVFLLFQVFGPANSVAGEGVTTPRMRSHHLRVPRRGLWGESLPRNGNVDAGSSSGSSDTEEQVRISSRRQRRSRNRAEG